MESSGRRYVLYCNDELLRVSQDTMLAQLEIRNEHILNQKIAGYLSSVGLKGENPWCAAGQYYCFSRAAAALRRNTSEIPILRSGSVAAIVQDAVKRGKRSSYIPHVHDLIAWLSGNGARGHIERVVSVGSGGWVVTVGFNTYDPISGRRGIYLRKRNIFLPSGKLGIFGLIGFSSERRES